MFTQLFLLLIFAPLYYFGCMGAEFKKVKWKEVLNHKNILVTLLISVGMCFFVNFAMPIVTLIIPDSIMREYDALMENAGFGQSVIPTITSILVAPFSEELMFRGVLFYYLLKIFEVSSNRRVVFGMANITQALLFGMFHMNIIQGGYAFVIGLTLGYLAHRFHSIIPAILAHMMNNVLSTFVWGHLVNALPESYAVYAVCAGLSVIWVIIGFLLSERWKKQFAEECS